MDIIIYLLYSTENDGKCPSNVFSSTKTLNTTFQHLVFHSNFQVNILFKKRKAFHINSVFVREREMFHLLIPLALTRSVKNSGS